MADVKTAKALVAETGRMLLEKKLVARTWGNISARVDSETFAISPSGLDYLSTTDEDVAVVKLADMTWEGKRKPSSEKGIHAAAYRTFDDVGFVIHTHQDFATALGLCGFDENKMTAEQKAKLGHIEIAAYGLPGTGKLAGNVTAAFQKGAKVVLMAHHGAVILGSTREDAFEKAIMLEEACKAQLQCDLSKEDACRQVADRGRAVKAQLDDMAQMIGSRLIVVENDPSAIDKALAKHEAILVKGVGVKVKAVEKADEEALAILANKACIAYLHTSKLGRKCTLSAFDDWLMRTVYKLKYSKKKNA